MAPGHVPGVRSGVLGAAGGAGRHEEESEADGRLYGVRLENIGDAEVRESMDRKAEAQYLAAAVEAADIKGGGERRAFVLGTLKAIINADDLTPKEIVGRCRYFLAEVGIREQDYYEEE